MVDLWDAEPWDERHADGDVLPIVVMPRSDKLTWCWRKDIHQDEAFLDLRMMKPAGSRCHSRLIASRLRGQATGWESWKLVKYLTIPSTHTHTLHRLGFRTPTTSGRADGLVGAWWRVGGGTVCGARVLLFVPVGMGSPQFQPRPMFRLQVFNRRNRGLVALTICFENRGDAQHTATEF